MGTLLAVIFIFMVIALGIQAIDNKIRGKFKKGDGKSTPNPSRKTTRPGDITLDRFEVLGRRLTDECPQGGRAFDAISIQMVKEIIQDNPEEFIWVVHAAGWTLREHGKDTHPWLLYSPMLNRGVGIPKELLEGVL